MQSFSIKLDAIRLLYLSYIIFFIASLFSNHDSAIFLYISNLLTFSLFLLYLFFSSSTFNLPKSPIYLSLIFIILGFIVIQPVSNMHIYTVFLLLKAVIVFLFFFKAKLKELSFLNFLNVTYLLYIVTSILFWIELIPSPNFNPLLIRDELLITMGSFRWYVLPGIEGSPANIDSYSAVIFLINIFVNASQKYRRLVIFSAVIGVFLSFRMTAIAGIALLLVLSPLLKRRFWFVSFNLVGFIAFLILLYAIHIDLKLNIFNVSIDMSTFAYLATHARSMIWEQQIVILYSEYNWYHYIFGGFNIERFGVPTFQASGLATDNILSNPHNTYLLLFFRSPTFMLLMLLLLFVNMLKSGNKKYYVPISFILLACYTNSAILSLENPIYIYILIFFLLNKKRTVNVNAENNS